MSAVQLTSAQWRDIVFGNLSRMLAYVQMQTELGPLDNIAIQKTLDETKGFVGAWHLAGLPKIVEPVPHEAAKPHENGAAIQVVVKKRGGWPKGRKRIPKIDRQARA